MASPNAVREIRGLDGAAIDAAVAAYGEDGIPAAIRHNALEAALVLPAPGPSTGRYWRIDTAKLDFSTIVAYAENAPAARAVTREAGEAARFEQTDATVTGIDVDQKLAAKGVVVCDFATAVRDYPDTVAWASGSAVEWRMQKFAALNTAFRYGGAFVFVPAGVSVDEPIVLRYHSVAGALFPYTLVIASEGSRVTVVSHVEGGDFEGALIGEIVEVIAKDGADVNFAAVQSLATQARVFSTRRASIGKGARMHWSVAELGSALSVSNVHAVIGQPEVQASISGIFFADGTQHIDVESEVDHRVGETYSDTVFRSAASGRGQARYLGNIRIHPHAHGSDATLRDDALLLSKTAHIDSIPALEIAANDVRAFHGATVGAIDHDEIFYAMSRGIDRASAERMIALGFFEPAIARFPTEALRTELREGIARKIV